MRGVAREGVVVTVVGVCAGVPLMVLIAPFLHDSLSREGMSDAVRYVAASARLVTVACAACLLPARRATRIEPMSVLRHD